MTLLEYFAFVITIITLAVCTWLIRSSCKEIRSDCREIMDRLEILHGIINGDYRKLDRNDETIAKALNKSNRQYTELMKKQLNILRQIAEVMRDTTEAAQNSKHDAQTYEQEERDEEEN